MLYIPKSLYDLHKYFSFPPQPFNIMKKLCKKLCEIPFLKILT